MGINLSKEQERELRRIEIQLNSGNIQVGFNAILDLVVVIKGDGLNYTAHYVQDGNLVSTHDIGFDSSLGYWPADQLAEQGANLPAALLINT